MFLAIAAQTQLYERRGTREVSPGSAAQQEATAAATTGHADMWSLVTTARVQSYALAFIDISSWLANLVLFQRAGTVDIRTISPSATLQAAGGAVTQVLHNTVFANRYPSLQEAIDAARSAGEHTVRVTRNEAISRPIALANDVNVVCAPGVSIYANFTTDQPYMVVGSSIADAGLWCKLDGRGSLFVGSGLYLTNVKRFRGRIEVWNTGKRSRYTSFGVRINGCTDCQIDSIMTRNHGLRTNTGAGVNIAGVDANLHIGEIDAEYSQETDGNGDVVIENSSGPVYINRIKTASKDYLTSADGVHIRSVPGGVNDVRIEEIDTYGNRAAALSLGNWANGAYINSLRSSNSGGRCMEIGAAQGPQQALRIGRIQCLNPNRFLRGIIGAVAIQGPNARTLITRNVTIGSIKVVDGDATAKVNAGLLIRNAKSGQTVSDVSVGKVVIEKHRGTLVNGIEIDNIPGGTLKNIDIGSLQVSGTVTHKIALPTRGTVINVHGPARP